MTGLGATLEKRIKRRVSARDHEWFAATAPGLEALCRSELAALLGDADPPVAVAGGVRFCARLYDGYRANLHLRTANRVLMRVDTFRASSFRQLQHRLAAIPWELYLPWGERPRPIVTTRKSRLYHSKAIAEHVLASVADRWGSLSAVGTGGRRADQLVFVRADQDHFTVSLDSSGDLLYKRGIKVHGGAAPLRETLAAAVLMLAGYDGCEPLIDPMCGSGTFSLEAAMMAARMPPGWFRRFAFMTWPAFQSSQWRHIREQVCVRAESESPVIFSSDKDRTACATLRAAGDAHGLGGRVRVAPADFFDLTPERIFARESLKWNGQTGLVVINPPYGRRLSPETGGRQMTRSILKKLAADFRGWRFALIAPPEHLPRVLPLDIDRFPLRHGGLALNLLIGRVA